MGQIGSGVRVSASLDTITARVPIINCYPAAQLPASIHPGIACVDCGFRGGPMSIIIFMLLQAMLQHASIGGGALCFYLVCVVVRPVRTSAIASRLPHWPYAAMMAVGQHAVRAGESILCQRGLMNQIRYDTIR